MTLAAKLKAAGWGQDALLRDALALDHLCAPIALSMPPHSVTAAEWWPILEDAMRGQPCVFDLAKEYHARLGVCQYAAVNLAWAALSRAVKAGILRHDQWRWVKV